MTTQEQAWHVSEAMQRYGGSFVSNLGRALAHADSVNMCRIKEAFPEYWEEYLTMGQKMHEAIK